MRVLVAEDEPLLADNIAAGLRRRSMAVDVCYDGDAALERVTTHAYDIVILDRDLPQVHGDEVCRRIVAEGGETPNHSPSPNWSHAWARSDGGHGPPYRRSWNVPGSSWTCPGARQRGMA